MRPAKASPFGRGVCAADGEGKPGTKEHLHSDKHWLLIESSYRCVFVLSQRPCPLRRSAPAPPKGEPLACRSGFPSYNLSVSLRSTAPLVGEPLAKPFTLRGLPKPPLLGATATTAASGGNREELLGPRPAGCERQRSRRWEPQPGQCHCFAMTERASSLFCLLYLQKSGHQSRIITYVS